MRVFDHQDGVLRFEAYEDVGVKHDTLLDDGEMTLDDQQQGGHFNSMANNILGKARAKHGIVAKAATTIALASPSKATPHGVLPESSPRQAAAAADQSSPPWTPQGKSGKRKASADFESESDDGDDDLEISKLASVSPMAALTGAPWTGTPTPKKAKAKAKGAAKSASKSKSASLGSMTGMTLPAAANPKDEKEIKKLAKQLDGLFAEADVALDLSEVTESVQGLRFRCQTDRD